MSANAVAMMPKMTKMTETVEPFAMIPEWVLFSDLRDRSVRLIGVLMRHDGEQGAFPSRKRLATILNCSTDSVDKAVKELESYGLIKRNKRFNDDGSQRSNLFELRLGGAVHKRPRSRVSAAHNESNITKVSFNLRAAKNGPIKINGKGQSHGYSYTKPSR